MYNEKQIERLLKKLQRLEKAIEPLIFEKVDSITEFEIYHTKESLTCVPSDDKFTKASAGCEWGGEDTYYWMKAQYTVPEALDGRQIYLYPRVDFYEALFFKNKVPYGIFANKIIHVAHGNHYSDLLENRARAGQTIDIALELYAGQYVRGTQPYENAPMPSFRYENNGLDICVKNYEIQEIYFDLVTVNQLARTLPDSSFRKGEVVAALTEAHSLVLYSIEEADREDFLNSLRKIKPILKRVLSVKADDSSPFGALIGHSHMDTAWLWHVGETVKKCARTYSNQLALMDEYPEHRFIQSSSCHSDFIRKYYPELFEKIKERVKEGRYEPNGGVWVECDCNITSGEAMIRQFLWGQRFTRKHFDYTSNCFWLPDTFGYSAAIPQIMKGCCVDYFLTTKISWNDTNEFPYDTFYWQGIDGTKVFSHFNTTHHFPDVENVAERFDNIKQKSVTNKRLLAYGYGDGGGGPMFEEIELSKRIENLSGLGKTRHMACGEFMKELEKEVKNPNVYRGELYLELHRGTLTNQHTIKRNNRKSEIALHDLELLTVSKALAEDKPADIAEINSLWETLLMNQFHDILPGTCINRAHVESRKQTSALLASAHEKIKRLTEAEDESFKTFTNTTSFDREDVIFAEYNGKIAKGDYKQQIYKNLDGKDILLIAGAKIPALSSLIIEFTEGKPSEGSAFKTEKNKLIKGDTTISFAQNGTIDSLTLGEREVRGEGLPLNTFIMAEDLPLSWDNWDIDADIEPKFAPVSELLSRELISDGEVAYIVRSTYKISAKSTVTQDMIIFADSEEIRFDTVMDWQDNHRLLKACFDTTAFEDFARQEIQFGYAKRPTTRNNSIEQAKFEVLNHKYTDISESRFGVSVLNDCKYAITVNGGSMRLSLHKGGLRPDVEGDHDGLHRCVYSLLPHEGGFSAEAVTKPAYLLNYPILEAKGKSSYDSLCCVSAENIIIETIKPCEDSERAFIARLYECEGTFTRCSASLCDKIIKAESTNMLEETLEPVAIDKAKLNLSFRPFEIKTLKLYY